MVSSSSQAGTIPGDKVGGKREREKLKGERCWVLSTSPSLSQLFTPQRLFFRERSDQFILSSQKCTHACTCNTDSQDFAMREPWVSCVYPCDTLQLKTRGWSKLHWFFMGLGALKLFNSFSYMQVQRWTFPIISMRLHTRICLQDLSQVQHWPRAGLAPYPPAHHHHYLNTHTQTLCPPSRRSSWSPPDPNSWGRRRRSDLSSPQRGEREKIYAIAHLSCLSLSVSCRDIISLCSNQLKHSNNNTKTCLVSLRIIQTYLYIYINI